MYKRILLLSIMLLLINITTAKAQYNLEAGIWDTAWNSAGTLLAVANPNGRVYVYDTAGELRHSFFGHDQRARSVAWSPNGQILASGGNDRFIRFWDVDTGELLHEMNILISPTIDLAWQPNGTYLAVASSDTIRVWDTTTYEPMTIGAGVTILDLEWSPDGSNFAFGSTNAAGIATIDGEQFDVTLFLHSNEPAYMRASSVSWNADGTQILSAHDGEGVYIWDAKTLDLVRVLFQNDDEFSDALFVGEDDARVITITTEGSVYILDALTGEVLESTHEDVFLWSLAWNPEHDLLAIGGSSNPLSTDLDTDAMATGFLSLRTMNLE